MTTDAELLKRYAQGGSEAAFTELVERHVNLVYGAAIRQSGGDITMAEDITQTVFNALAREAEALSRHPALGGWLYIYVRHLTANQRRADRRRQQREQTSIKMNSENDPGEPDTLWEEVKPVLDDAMDGLNEQDRTAVALRFHQNRSLREVGAALGLSENAARMRVGRALDKLRNLLAERGVTSTTAGLTAALGVGASVCAPPGMAATIAAEAVAAHACVGAASTATTLATIMNLTKLKLTLAAVLVTAGLGLPVWQAHRIQTLRQENSKLQAELSELPGLRTEVERLKRANAASPPPIAVAAEDDSQEATLEIARLRGRLNMALTRLAEQETALAAATNQPPAKIGDAVRDAARMAIQTQTLGKLPLLTERLSLSPYQQEKVRAILQRQFDQTLELAEKTLTGELTREKMQPTKGAFVNPKAEITALLTPEQRIAYQEYEQEEHSANARLAANSELLQIQSSLGLTQEQQDQAFQALYQHTFETMTNQKGPPAELGQDYASSLKWTLDQKVQALESVLTAGQLEQYRELQKQKLKMMSSMLPQK